MKNQQNKTIIVAYVGVRNMTKPQIDQYMTKLIRSLSHDKEIISYAVPVKGKSDIRLECINPVLLEQAEYQNVKDTLDKYREKLIKFLHAKVEYNSTS